MVYFMKMFKLKKVIFFMDVDGIYDGKFGEGIFILEFVCEEVFVFFERFYCIVVGIDVIGGICNKLRKVYEMVYYFEVWFVNGKVFGRLSGVIRGDGFGMRLR